MTDNIGISAYDVHRRVSGHHGQYEVRLYRVLGYVGVTRVS